MSDKTFTSQVVATLLETSPDTLRRWMLESGIETKRREKGPQTRLFTAENIYELASWRAKRFDKRPAKPVVFTVYAPKGGVGKTTIAANLACIFPLMGLKTLAIDIDFQSNLTLSFGYDSEITPEEAEARGMPASDCIEYHSGHLIGGYEGRAEPIPLHNAIKKPYGEHGPHLLPSDVSLDYLDTFLTYLGMQKDGSDLFFSKLLVNGRKPGGQFSDYDVILWDAAPAKNKITRNALMASDYVVAPVSLEKYSTKSVSYLSSVLSDMKESAGRCPELCLLGNFYTPTRPRVLDQMQLLRSKYSSAWVNSLIRQSEEFKKNLSTEEHEMPLSISRPTSNGAADMRTAAKALLDRMGVLPGVSA